MSKRALIFTASFALPFLVGGGLLLIFPQWGPLADPVYTDEIPAKRPKNPDRHLLERYEGRPLSEVIAERKTEREAALAKGRGDESPTPSGPPAILAMLPDAPLPFPPEATPRDEAGLKEFVTSRQQGAESAPASEEEKWQFNLALAALGVKVESVPEAIRMNARPQPESDSFPIRLVPRKASWTATGPVITGDFDGAAGLEVVTGGGSAMFQIGAEGDPVRLDALEGTEPGDVIRAADFDGDGDLDLFIGRRHGLPDSLLRNEGGAKFSDETAAFGLLAFGDTKDALWLDYDQDGMLDLLVAYEDRPMELYQQQSVGGFQAVAWDIHLWVPGGVAALAAGDVDGDGFPDLLVGREDGRARLLISQPAVSWGDWAWGEVEAEFGFAQGSAISAARFFDCDNDGLPDLVVTTASPDAENGALRLLHNGGGGRFVDATEAVGLRLDDPVLSLATADLDRDGFDELLLGTGALVPDRIFANQGGTGFGEVSVAARGSWLDDTAGITPVVLGAGAEIDLLTWRGDGSLRWLVAEGEAGSWVRVELPGQPSGTRVVAAARDRDWVVHTFQRLLEGGGNVTLGLGGAEIVERLEVFDAAGGEPLKALEKVEPNRVVTVQLPPRAPRRAAAPVAPEEGSQEAAP